MPPEQRVDHAAVAPDRVGRALVVPVVARAELLPPEDRTALVGLRADRSP